jgi:hypothetical protein
MTSSAAWALGQKLYHFQSQLFRTHRPNVSSFAVYFIAACGLYEADKIAEGINVDRGALLSVFELLRDGAEL